MKQFYIKLISVTFAIIVILNVAYNLFFTESMNKINNILSLSETSNRMELRDKFREELKQALNKENLLAEEDKEILYKLYKKIQNEFKTVSD